jgi:LytS/YehU family sensor histidine kinase
MRHSADPVSGRIRISVRAQKCGGELSLEVKDSGTGAGGESANGHGVGLKNLTARLGRLYGAGGRLSIEHGSAGTRVSISIPYRHEHGEPGA